MKIAFVAAALCALAACSNPQQEGQTQDRPDPDAPTAEKPDLTSEVVGELIDDTVPATPPELTTPAAAVAVLEAYCAAVANGDDTQAAHYWTDGDVDEDHLDRYDAYDCDFDDPLDRSGAAGSTYLTVPARITGTLATGGGFLLEGEFVMRRSNDVPGSTEEERHWRIYRAKLEERRP